MLDETVPAGTARGNAICVTGLQRSFPEISGNIVSVMQLLNASAGGVHLFGVRPANDSWTTAKRLLQPMTIEMQRPCRPASAPTPWFFTCTRGGHTSRGGHCAANFVQSLCDLKHCERMIRRHESRLHQRFALVTRLRLDVAFEAEPVPPALTGSLPVDEETERSVWVPHMNGQRGVNDKFAIGGRAAMASYLRRVELLELNYSAVPRDAKGAPVRYSCSRGACRPTPFPDAGAAFWAAPGSDAPHPCGKKSGCMISLNSERFLSFALWRANVTVQHRQDWMLCKFGNDSHAWPTCTRRLRQGTPCSAFVCLSWQAGGCSCLNTSCAVAARAKGSKAPSPWCTDVL